jgi:hypothetical protein
VFRSILLSIVLTLAVGQNAVLLCQVWCHDPPSAGCPHQDSTTSPSLSVDDSCSGVLAEPVAFDARRTAAAQDAPNVLAVTPSRSAFSPTDLRPGSEPGRRRPVEERPRFIALRI